MSTTRAQYGGDPIVQLHREAESGLWSTEVLMIDATFIHIDTLMTEARHQ